jgi:uncharacterized protein YbaA (DUF1428 family)
MTETEPRIEYAEIQSVGAVIQQEHGARRFVFIAGDDAPGG